MEKTKMMLSYVGTLDITRDNQLIAQAERSGYSFVGCGYNFLTQTRDFIFEGKE